VNTYSQFEDEFLVAAYELCEETGNDAAPVREILEKYAFEPKSNWVGRALQGLIDNTYAKDYRHIGPDIDQEVHLSPLGARHAERLLKEGVRPPKSSGVEEVLPPQIKDVSGGRVLLSDGPVPPDLPGREGDILFELGDTHTLLPASDRMVPLDHNSAPYSEVRNGLAELHEELRTANDLDCTPDERERLLASLAAAQTLWESAQLKIIQIKVGIIITIEDSIELLSKAGKAVGKSALIDLVKSIVRHATGIHL
jgi:hypothetical protein